MATIGTGPLRVVTETASVIGTVVETTTGIVFGTRVAMIGTITERITEAAMAMATNETNIAAAAAFVTAPAIVIDRLSMAIENGTDGGKGDELS